MKNIYRIVMFIAVIFAAQPVLAQNIGNLDGISYQAVAIDDQGKEIVGVDIEGNPVNEKSIDVRFTIQKGESGSVEYEEEHTTNTDENGLFSLTIGHGEVTGGEYTHLMDIPWIDADQWLKVEISIEGRGYRMVSLQKFMTVPYSFYTDDIADNAITSAKVLDSAIINQDVATSAVDSRTILDSTILNQDVATSAVDSRTIMDETIVNEDIADSTIDLTSKVTEILPVPNGGTGTDSLTANSLILGNGTDSLTSLGQATDGQIPIGSTGGAPVLGNISAGTGIIVNNTAGGIEISSGVQGVNTQETGSVNVGNLQGGDVYIEQVTLQGVAPGDFVVASYSNPLQGCLLSAYVRNNNQIEVVIFNPQNNQKNLGTGTFSVLVIK